MSYIADGLLLYADDPVTAAAPRSACPDPIRVAAAWSSVLGRVLTLFCGADLTVPICIAGDHAVFPISETFDTPPYASLADLIDDISDINEWLLEWASSATRKPCLAPVWATRRGVDNDRVHNVSTAIAGCVSSNATQRVRFASTCGKSGTLVIPPRIQLSPQIPSTGDSLSVRIRDVKSHVIAISQNGSRLHYPESLIPEQFNAGMMIEVPIALAYRETVRISNDVRVVVETMDDNDAL